MVSRRPLLLALLLLLSLTQAACGSGDTTLHVAPPVEPVEEGGGGGSGSGGRPPGGGWPGLPELPTGPWGELDPGEMPSVWFVVAWAEPGCCDNCDGALYDELDGDENEDGTSQFGFAVGCEAKYGIIDLFGQVIAELRPPMPGGEQWTWLHTSIAPSGPGRFIATANGYYFPSWQEEPTDPPEDSWVPWITWEFDALTETATELARFDDMAGRVLLSESGRMVGSNAWSVRAAVDPEQPEWIYLWSDGYGCGAPPISLRAYHRFDSSIIGPYWSPDDLVGDQLAPQGDWLPYGFSTSLTEDGETQLFAQLYEPGCTVGELPLYTAVALSPRNPEVPVWRSVSTDPWAATGASWASWNGGALLEIESPYELPTWHTRGPGGELSGPVQGVTWNVRPGPMLDPAGPTFALIGGSLDGPYDSDRIVFHHGGEAVWTIDQLRFGLQPRSVRILDLVVLPPWEEEDGG